MQPPLTLRILTDDEETELRALAHGRKAEARLRDRARICWLAHQGGRVAGIATEVGCCQATVRTWIKRFNALGLAGLHDAGRSGRPPLYTAEEAGEVVATSLSDPQTLGQPFACWTLDRLQTYLNDERAIPIKRSRIAEILQAEGLRWRQQETWFGERVDPDFVAKRGRSSLSTRPRLRAVS